MKHSLSYKLSITLIIGGASLLHIQKSKAQEVISIHQAIEIALKNNLQIKQALYSEQLNEVNLQQSKLALAPSLNASISQNLGWGRNQVASGLYQNTKNLSINGGISTGVELFGGFAKLNQIKQNKALLDAGKTNVEKIKSDLSLNVISAYMQILFNKDLLLVSKEQKKVAEQQLEQVRAFLKAGTKTEADVSQAKAQLANAESTVSNNENTLAISYLNLSQLMEMPSTSPYEVQAPVVNNLDFSNAKLNADEVYQKSLSILPDIKLAETNTKAAEIGVKIAKSSYYPRLSFSASLGTSYFNSQNPFITNSSFENQLKDNLSKGIGLNLTIPIFNGSQARLGVKRANINLLQTQGQEQLSKNNLNKIVYQAVADAKASEVKYHSAQNVFAAQKDAFYAIERRYGVGLANSVEYNTALSNRNKAEIDMVQSKYELLLKTKIIDYYLGKSIIF